MATDIDVTDTTIVEFTGTFYDAAGTAGNPDEVAFSFQAESQPDPTVWVFGTDAEITNPVAGTFVAAVDTSGMAPEGSNTILTGQFNGKATSGGVLQAVGYRQVLVNAEPLPNPF